MANKKDRKTNFFTRAIQLSNKHFKGIFKEIVQNAKSNSDVDLNILEPDIKKTIREVADELKKEKDGASLKKEELKGIIASSLNSVKEALRNDTSNNIDDESKDEWIKELESLGLSSLVDDIISVEEEGNDISDEFSEESTYTDYLDKKFTVNDEEVKLAIAGATTILSALCSSKKDTFGVFFQEKSDLINEIVSYKTCKGKESPVDIPKKDSVDTDIFINRSIELVDSYMSMEDDIIPVEYVSDGVSEPEDETDGFIEYLENMIDPEVEEVDNSKLDEGIMNEDVKEEYLAVVKESDDYMNKLNNLRNTLSDSGKNVLDLCIYILLTVYNLYIKYNNETSSNNCCELENNFIDFVRDSNIIPLDDLADAMGLSEPNMDTIEVSLICIMNLECSL